MHCQSAEVPVTTNHIAEKVVEYGRASGAAIDLLRPWTSLDFLYSGFLVEMNVAS